MADAVKFHQFLEDLHHGVHDLSSDALKLMLTNVAPSAADDAVLADLTEISAGNGYAAGGAAMASTSGQTAGTYALAGETVTWTASGGTIGPFRYVVLYNDAPTAPADPLIQYWDCGEEVTLQAGGVLQNSFAFDPSDGSDRVYTAS